jgi:large subunit ribosomal protein L3
MGNKRATQKNIDIVKIDAANNLLLVKGAVPGANSGFVYVRTAKSITRMGGKKS